MAKSRKLEKVTQEWMQLERKTFEQRKLAEEFYDANLMTLIEEDYVKRNRGQVFEKVDYLVVSVGTSYEPIVLNITLLHPKRILFLYTEKSEAILNKVVSHCKITPDSYEKSRVSETSPLDIYQEIKHSYLKWDRPEKMYIDFTGGTKAMSVASAMAGAMINVQMVYVGSNDYLVDFRKPRPGSETLFYITNPLAVFGDLEIEKALNLFAEHNYAGAQEKLAVLKEMIPDPNNRQELNFVYLLARAYESWDALDFIPAYNAMSQLNKQLKRDRMTHGKFLLMDFADALQRQEKILGRLKGIPELVRVKENQKILTNPPVITALMFTMLQNALIREKQEKNDMSTLLLYRLLEMMEQRRLAGYNINVSKAEYLEIRYKREQTPEMIGLSPQERLKRLKEQIAGIKEQLFRRKGNEYLSEQISLLEGFILLYALGDPIVCDEGNSGIGKLKQIRSKVYLRNNSIFAHGLGPVSYTDFQKFKTFVLEMFQNFCKIEKIDYEAYTRNMVWLNPMDSLYYAKGSDR